MKVSLLSDDVALQGAFDAVPVPLFIVDHDVRILHANAAVHDALGLDAAKVYGMRAGKAFHCVNEKQTAAGCGRGTACDDCGVRATVASAIQGSRTHRKTARLDSEAGGVKRALKLQVSASPFPYGGKPYVLLVLEPMEG